MIAALEQAKRLGRDAEALLGEAHTLAANCRDASPSGSVAKAEARSIANRIEKALQSLERIG